MKLSPNLTQWLVPEKTLRVYVSCYPTHRHTEIRVRVAPTRGLEFDLGCILGAQQAETLASIQSELEARHYYLDESSLSPRKLIFRYCEASTCLSSKES